MTWFCLFAVVCRRQWLRRVNARQKHQDWKPQTRFVKDAEGDAVESSGNGSHLGMLPGEKAGRDAGPGSQDREACECDGDWPGAGQAQGSAADAANQLHLLTPGLRWQPDGGNGEDKLEIKLNPVLKVRKRWIPRVLLL